MRPFDRTAMLDRLADETFDVLVVGGGITGAGVALDAATRGLRTALVERDDFASGTSSKSSKLVHGGLRYLQQGEVRLVYEALHERQRLRRNAPHLVKVLPFLIPILTKDGVISPKIARALGSAMWMYDLTGGWRIGKLHRRLEGRRGVRPPADDAAATGSPAATSTTTPPPTTPACAHARPHRRRPRRGRRQPLPRSSALTTDADGRGRRRRRSTPTAGDDRRSRATVVVNAAGVWADDVRALDEGAASATRSGRPRACTSRVPWAHGAQRHRRRHPGAARTSAACSSCRGARNADGTFEHTYVGTTDTDYDGPLDDPQCTADDIDYVLGALNARSIDHAAITARRHHRRVGRAAPARASSAVSGRTADLSRRHQRRPSSPAGVDHASPAAS